MGGGIYSAGADATVTIDEESVLSGNKAGFCRFGSEECIAGNDEGGDGAGLYLAGDGAMLDMTGGEVRGNVGERFGGGFYLAGDDQTVTFESIVIGQEDPTGSDNLANCGGFSNCRLGGKPAEETSPGGIPDPDGSNTAQGGTCPGCGVRAAADAADGVEVDGGGGAFYVEGARVSLTLDDARLHASSGRCRRRRRVIVFATAA